MIICMSRLMVRLSLAVKCFHNFKVMNRATQTFSKNQFEIFTAFVPEDSTLELLIMFTFLEFLQIAVECYDD